MPYAAMLNRVLPPDIRVIAVADADADFNARFVARDRFSCCWSGAVNWFAPPPCA